MLASFPKKVGQNTGTACMIIGQGRTGQRSRRSGQGHPQFSLLRPDSIAGAAVRVTAARTDKLSPVGGGGTSQTGYLIMRPTRQISAGARGRGRRGSARPLDIGLEERGMHT